jgi:hypothetical protein
VRGICLYGLTGVGKSTFARLLHDALAGAGVTSVVLKLADPLYRLQAHFYASAGMRLDPGRQDQVLLEAIALQLRRISRTCLVDDFEARFARSGADVIINDDLRDPDVDYARLRQLGFRFAHITADEAVRRQRLAGRDDVSVVVDSETTRRLSAIRPDLVVDNSGSEVDQLPTTAVPAILGLL